MQTLSILRHAVLQILRQPAEVLRIFVLPLTASFPLIKLTGLAYILSPFYLQIAINRGIVPWGKAMLVVLVGIFLFAWAAAAWHRFILLGERPTKLWPSLSLRTYGYFLLQSLWVAALGFAVILLASVLSGVVLGFAAAMTDRPPGWIAVGLSLLVAFPIMTVAIRLAVNLPKAALEAPKEISVWEATA